MNVAVDARELAGRSTGVGRYLQSLLKEWAGSHDARRHQWQLFSHQAINVPVEFASAVTVLGGDGGTQWEQWTLQRALSVHRPDLLFAPGYSAPLASPCPIALTVHDVSFFAHPQWFSWREGLRRRTLTRWSARRARTVLTDSAFSRDQIVAHLGIAPDKINVVRLGMERTSQAANPDDHDTREPIILFVGSIFRRRHVDALIAAFVSSVAQRVPASRLEIVGENRMHPAMDLRAALARCPPDVAARVTLRSYVDEDTLHNLYRAASVFAFPSEYEGFGLTPLEALAAGVPPVVLDTPIAREVYGGAARYVPTDFARSNALADALVELLTSRPARRDILAAADQVLARYDWSRTAAQTLHALEEAAHA